MTETAPSLAEIANMPTTEARKAMRAHYDPNWGTAEPEAGAVVPWVVSIDYSSRVEDFETFTVEAASEEEAIEIAEAQLREQLDAWCDLEIDTSTARRKDA